MYYRFERHREKKIDLNTYQKATDLINDSEELPIWKRELLLEHLAELHYKNTQHE